MRKPGTYRLDQGIGGLSTSTRTDALIVEDDADQQRLIARVLERAGCSTSGAASMREGMERVRADSPRVVVCDYELPDGDGVHFLRAIRKDPDLAGTYCILVSATGGSDLATNALDAVADDYLAKPIGLRELAARVRVGLRMWTMHDQLRQAATTDALTGLSNHGQFHRVLESEMGRSRRYGHPLALIMLDLDFFKAINDTYGHVAGNQVLEELAGILNEGVRDVDTVGRLGGEEFGIILPEARTLDALQVAERIRVALPKSLSIRTEHSREVTASFGIADSEDPRVSSAVDLVDLADRALYVAKRRGRNRTAQACDLTDRADVEATVQTDEVEWLRRRLAILSARVRDVYVQSVATLLKALDEKDPHAARHSVNVAFYAEEVADRIGCSTALRKSVYNAALLHDIGKVGVPDSILAKRTPLTPLEQMVIEQVPLIGTRIVDHMRILESEIQIIRHQREYYDGSGVPAGLKGDQIPIGSRILLVADAFDAMTTDRIYRVRRPVSEAVEELQRGGGTQFDSTVVDALISCFQQNAGTWEKRIADTLRAARVPSDDGLSVAADGFVPGSY